VDSDITDQQKFTFSAHAELQGAEMG